MVRFLYGVELGDLKVLFTYLYFAVLKKLRMQKQNLRNNSKNNLLF